MRWQRVVSAPQEGKTAPTPSERDREAALPRVWIFNASIKAHGGKETVRAFLNKRSGDNADEYMGVVEHQKQLAEAVARARAEAKMRGFMLGVHQASHCKNDEERQKLFDEAATILDALKAQQAPVEDGNGKE